MDDGGDGDGDDGDDYGDSEHSYGDGDDDGGDGDGGAVEWHRLPPLPLLVYYWLDFQQETPSLV